MERIASREWQSHRLRYTGPTHTDPNHVYRDILDLAHSSEVLGRISTASRLRSLVTPEVCRKYAPLLTVLYELSSISPKSVVEPDLEELSGDLRNSGEASSFQFSDIDDPNEGVSELSDLDEVDVDAEEQQELDTSSEVNAEPHQSTLNRAIRFQDLVRFAHSEPTILEDDDSNDNSNDYSQKDLVSTVLVLLNGYDCERPEYKKISTKCNNSIWFYFVSLREKIADLPSPQVQASVLNRIRELECNTIIQLMVGCEQIMNSTPACDVFGIGVLNEFLSGKLVYPFKVTLVETSLAPAGSDPTKAVEHWMKGKSAFNDIIYSNFRISPQLHHPKLYSAAVFASVLNHEFNVTITPNLKWESEIHYKQQVYELAWSLQHRLANTGLQHDILRMWDFLSSIYLAQDPRVLEFLNEWLCIDPEDSANYDIAASKLMGIWDGNPPFKLNHEFVPVLTVDDNITPYIRTWLGPYYSKLFNPDILDEYWYTVVEAFRTGDQVVELELREIHSRVRASLNKNCFAPALKYPPGSN